MASVSHGSHWSTASERVAPKLEQRMKVVHDRFQLRLHRRRRVHARRACALRPAARTRSNPARTRSDGVSRIMQRTSCRRDETSRPSQTAQQARAGSSHCAARRTSSLARACSAAVAPPPHASSSCAVGRVRRSRPTQQAECDGLRLGELLLKPEQLPAQQCRVRLGAARSPPTCSTRPRAAACAASGRHRRQPRSPPAGLHDERENRRSPRRSAVRCTRTLERPSRANLQVHRARQSTGKRRVGAQNSGVTAPKSCKTT